MSGRGRRRIDVRAWVTALSAALILTGCGGAKPSGDARPAAASNGVRLSPDPAYAASQIEVVFDDQWLDPAKCRYRWTRNGSTILGAETSTLDAVHVSKGSVIGVEVTVDDPSGTSKTLGAEVQVVNTPPKVHRVSLVVAAATGKAEVRASVEGMDPDQDEVSYGYHWFKNDVALEGASQPALPMASLTRGDRVTVEVVASDGQSTAPAVRSDVLEIENGPPSFTSQPTAAKPSDDAFRYRPVAADPDGDAVTYKLLEGPIGMMMSSDGSVSWSLPAKEQRSGKHRVRIQASDAKGGVTVHEFTIDLESSATRR
jgi:hypothetical protein